MAAIAETIEEDFSLADTLLVSDLLGRFADLALLHQPDDRESADMAVVKDAVANRLPKTLGYLEAQLAGKAFFVEDRLALADISVYAQIANREHAQHLPDPSHYPHLMGNFGIVKSQASSMSLRTSEMLYLKMWTSPRFRRHSEGEF